MTHQDLLPMTATGTENLVERAYREVGAYQWVRETLVNSLEAGATRVEFGIEWQAVENQGVYRRTIADNGKGMTAQELKEFFNTFGGGGKPIGGMHENFGIGAKTSLLPWNSYGLVVLSWVDGEGSMIWLKQKEETGQYGLRLVQALDPTTDQITLEHVYTPFEDSEHGCDWSDVKPNWIDQHGTVLVLLGNSPDYDTVLGDPNRDEADIKGISTYLNRRMWDIPKDVDVFVDELRTKDREKWPRSREEAQGSEPKTGPDRRTNTRAIKGAKYYISYPVDSFDKGTLADSGSMTLEDGTELAWYLWEGERPAVHSYAARGGFIAALYDNELYDVTNHHATYRSFGVSESGVRKRLWLIARPPKADSDGQFGVYPRSDRVHLLVRGGPHAGDMVPLSDWGAEFSERMPEAIRDAIRKERSGDEGSLEDDEWRERLQDRFGSRWKVERIVTTGDGDNKTDPTQTGGVPVSRTRSPSSDGGSSGGEGGRSGPQRIGKQDGDTEGTKKNVAGGIPTYKVVNAEDVEDGMLAAWQPNHPEHPEGVVLLNVDHPVMEQEIQYMQDQYPDHLSKVIMEETIRAYGEVAVAKVAHSEHLRGILPSSIVDEDLRSSEALTMSLLGLVAEESLLTQRLAPKFRKRQAAKNE